MRHPFAEQVAEIRLKRRRTDALIFVIAVSAGLSLLISVALSAPPSWFPLQ